MTEFTVHMANRPGRLATLAGHLAAAGIGIETLAASTCGDEASVRLIVDDEPAARQVLRDEGLFFEERTVLTTVLPNRPEALAEMTRQLAESGANIDAMYLIHATPDGLRFAIALDDHPAERVGG